MTIRRWVAAGLAVAALGCAKREPPSGGPPDIQPPQLVESKPDSGSASLVPGTISLMFSEPMEPRFTSAAVQIAPPVRVRRARWSGSRMLTLEPEEPLRPNQTYTVVVGATARDRHGNEMINGATVVFSTGSKFPPGRIEGDIDARGFAGAGTSLWCYEASRTGVPDSTARDFDAIGIANEEGHFRVDGLTVPGRYRLWAFADLNANRSFEPDPDILTAIDTIVALTDSMPIASIGKLPVVNQRAPGTVEGTVLDSLGDSTGVIRVIAIAVDDSTLRGEADVNRERHFELSLRAGVWLLRAYLDRDGDRDWGSREPSSEPVTVRLGPAVEVSDVRLVLRGPP